MKKFTKVIALALILAHAGTESYMIIWKIWEESANIKALWFIDNSSVPDGLSVLWYIKYMSDDILWVTTYMCFARVAYQYSLKIFLIVSIFVLYHLLDTIMFFVNFKSSHWLYIVLLGMNAAALVLVFLPMKPKAKVVSME